MCGIAGVIDAKGRPVDAALLGRMCRALRHRGPDDEGIHLVSAAGVRGGLGARRLSIIDVADGHQPMSNEDETVWVVQNGEIYNFVELREELEARGHRFRTRSDTEVIVHAYEEYGDECAARLHGMFALAVWDTRRRRLLLARDRIGKKPLVYSEQNGRLAFASELGALLTAVDGPRDLDATALDAYLTYLAVPAPLTIYRNVRKLPPAHILTFEDGRVSVRRYWDLAFEPKVACSEGEATEQLVALLRDAVRRRLVSEVPVGALLSGGVDSAIVTGLMARLLDRPVKTFSIGFEEPQFNELPGARRAAQAFGCDHHEFVVKPRAAEALPVIVEHFGEPFADSSALPTYHLAQLTRGHVTVALSGDGGDELFAGYGRHFASRLATRLSPVSGPLRAAVGLAARSRLGQPANGRHPLVRAWRFLDAARLSPAARYHRWVGHFTTEARADLYGRVEAVAPDAAASFFPTPLARDPVDTFLAVDTAFYLPTDLLTKMDIMSMAHSLEVRSPFLDHRVVEFAARLPTRFKLRGLTHKYLLKRAFANLAPHENLHATKRGFAVPLTQWFRDDLRDFLADHLLSRRCAERGLFDAASVRRLVEDHVAGRADHAHRLWVLLVLEVWFRTVAEGSR